MRTCSLHGAHPTVVPQRRVHQTTTADSRRLTGSGHHSHAQLQRCSDPTSTSLRCSHPYAPSGHRATRDVKLRAAAGAKDAQAPGQEGSSSAPPKRQQTKKAGGGNKASKTGTSSSSKQRGGGNKGQPQQQQQGATGAAAARPSSGSTGSSSGGSSNRGPQQQQQSTSAAAAPRSSGSDGGGGNSKASADPPAVLLVGFHPDESSALKAQLKAEGLSHWHVGSLTPDDMAAPLAGLQLPLRRVSPAQVVLGEGRLALVSGEAVQHIADLQHLLDYGGEEEDVPPPICGAITDANRGLPLGQVMAGLRTAHARMHSLYQPLAVDEAQVAAGPPKKARVAMNVAMDAGRVPACDGSGMRDDSSRLVVLDGLLTGAERGQLLDWLTEKGWDHAKGPPEGKWERCCSDRPGDPDTWGLSPAMLHALQHDPPPAMVALQSRLAGVYRRYRLGYMPAAALRPEDEEDQSGLSPFVGNAVVAGQSCSWHVDADPSITDPRSPWVQQFGQYYNREPGRPLFASAMVYLNETWEEDWDAETLFLDPDRSGGVFVRPAPGRVVLFDQDLPHRISAPNTRAGGLPRYSLVWKMVLWPEGGDAQQPAGVPNSARQDMSIALPEFGSPACVGSAAGEPVPLAWRRRVLSCVVYGNTAMNVM